MLSVPLNAVVLKSPLGGQHEQSHSHSGVCHPTRRCPAPRCYSRPPINTVSNGMYPVTGAFVAALATVCHRRVRSARVVFRTRRGVAAQVGGSRTFEGLSQAIASQDTDAVQKELLNLKAVGDAKLFASYPRNLPSGRKVSLFDLKSMGILAPSAMVQQQDTAGPAIIIAAFLAIGAAIASVSLQGQSISFFVTILLLAGALGAITVGSFAPDLLPKDPEEQKRATTHEAGHFLVGYLLGAPIRDYSIDASGKPSVEFNDKLGPLADYCTSRTALDYFCVVACGGIAGEGLRWEGSLGGAADLKALAQAIDSPAGGELLDPDAMMGYTRWGVFYAASMLRAHKDSWDALIEAMEKGADVGGCIEAIEKAAK